MNMKCCSGIWRLLLSVLVFCVAGAWFSCLADEPKAGTAKPAILLIDIRCDYWNPLVVQEMLDEGFEVAKLARSEKLTWEELKKFNMVILVWPPKGFDTDIRPLLDRFMNEGGGVLVVPYQDMAAEVPQTLPPVLRWLKGLGATLYGQGIVDPKREAKIDWCSWPGQPTYIWTSEMTDSPITSGVKNLWYRTGINSRKFLLSAPIEIDGNWRPIVLTGPDSVAVSWKEVALDTSPLKAANPDLYGEFMIPAGMKTGRQPLLAVRECGKGRLALFAVYPGELLWSGYIPAYDGVMLKRGFQGRPSDGWQLLKNLYRWLSAPSMKIAGLGGYKTVRNRIFREPPAPPRPRSWVNGDTPILGKPTASIPRGLVGAHTSYSTGTGTVAEWVKAAKAAKLDFLVFLEDFSHMNSDKWEKLKADCKACSDKDFLAFPSMEFQLELGDRGFLLEPGITWPGTNLLTRDGRRITTSRVMDSNTGVIWLYLFTGQSEEVKAPSAGNATMGYYSHKTNFTPAWDRRLSNVFPLFTRTREKMIDDFALQDYLVLQSQNLVETPIALSLMFKPKEIGEAIRDGWPSTTVLLDNKLKGIKGKGGWPFVTMLNDKQDMSHALNFAGAYCYAGRVGTLCATTGPNILNWDCTASVTYHVPRWRVAKREDDFYVLNNYRYRVRLRAASDKGLAEVLIYDGDKGVYRRFLPGGDKTFEVTLDLVNDQVRHLVAVVKDIAGGVAVSPEIKTENWLLRSYWCSDRCNFGCQPHGHGAGYPRPEPWTTQNGPQDLLLARWSFPVISPSVCVTRANLYTRFGTAGGYSCMWNTYYRTWPTEEMDITQTSIAWAGTYGGDVFFHEEHLPLGLDSIWSFPFPKEPFYKDTKTPRPDPIAGLPNWKAGHETKAVKLKKDVEFREDFVRAVNITTNYAAGWGAYDFRLGNKKVTGALPGAGKPELKLSGKARSGGIFALETAPGYKGLIRSVTGKDMTWRLHAADGKATLEIGWPAAPEQSRKGTVYRWESYAFDGAMTGLRLDRLLCPDGIEVLEGEFQAEKLPYTFMARNGAARFRVTDISALPFEWVHMEVHGLDPHRTAYYAEIKTPKLLLYMPFEDKNASLTRDRSGNSFDGSVMGATWTSSGKFAGAYCFDGIGDRIDTGEDSAFDFVSGDFSIAMWARKTENVSGSAISKGRSPGIFSWGLFWNPPVSAWQMYTTQGGVQWGCSLDTWHHIVVTREGSQLKMYGDGVLRDSTSLKRNLSDKATNLTIGAEPGGGSHFKGCLDEIRIYGNALSEAQVQALYEMAVAEHEEIGGPWVLGNTRPIAVDPDGVARSVLWREKKDMGIFIGHPVLCSDKRIWYDTVLLSDGTWIIEANNPTDRDLTVSLSTHPAWRGKVKIAKTVTIPKGGRINLVEEPNEIKKAE
ncbi:MAG: hypothetical protein L6437_16045 [Kiritimatiellae bacterium]|nr:hypothetical protein [Kiritimatiellia bacterium]